MSQSIVFAKTARPSARGVLPRERVFSCLDAASMAPMVWLQAPAGAGKTSAVVSYLEARQRRALWYQIDASDTDPATFFSHVARALDNGSRLPLFTAEYRDDPTAFAGSFFRLLAEQLDGAFLIVLDNYHELAADAPLHDLLREGLAELPAECALIAVSREPPPAPFIRMRANRELQMVSWSELRLTREESAAIVRESGRCVDDDRLEVIQDATQGWAAALILMLDGDAHGHYPLGVADGRAPQLLFDYLAEEVFQTFAPRQQQLLLAIAAVTEVTAALAKELSGDADAERCLDALVERHHLVSVKPGRDGALYQCHPLLREFLLRQAASSLSSERQRQIALSAARHLEAAGALDAARSQLAGAGAWDSLVAFIDTHAPSMLYQGRVDTLLAWIEHVPQPYQADPWLAFWRARCQFETDPLTALDSLERVFQRFVDASGLDWDGHALTVAAAMDAAIYARHELAVLDRWIPRALALARSMPLHAGEEARARLVVGLFMAMVFRQPHRPEIKEWAEQAFEACNSIVETSARTSSQLLMAINLSYTGQFQRASAFIEMLRPLASSGGSSPLAVTTLKTVESMYHMLLPSPERCLQVAFDGIDIAEESGVRVWSYHLLVNGTAGALADADVATAAELLDRMQAMTARAGYLDRTIYRYLRAWSALLEGNLEDAYAHQRSALELATAAGCPFYEALCQLAHAEVLAERGEPRRALRHLRRTRRLAVDIDNRLLHFACLCVGAHLALGIGRRALALRTLRKAFALGREHDFVHFLWWRAGPMSRLAALALEHGIEDEYVRTLIRRRALEPPPTKRIADHAWPWRFQLRSFGRFQILRDGIEVPRLSGKPLDLLKALVGHGGEEVREETLARAVWPRVDSDYAQKTLTTTLHRLRKVLGQDKVLRLRHGRLSLDASLCWLDVREFNHVLSELDALNLPEADIESSALDAITQRLFELYRGPFMGSEPPARVYPALREKHRSALLSALDTVARCREKMGAADRVPELYRQAEELDPTAEAFYRRHMLCLRTRGEPAQAVEVFGQLRAVLEASGGRSPTPETQAIYAAVVREL